MDVWQFVRLGIFVAAIALISACGTDAGRLGPHPIEALASRAAYPSYDSNNVDRIPKAISQPFPRNLRELRDGGISGSALLSVNVSEKGEVIDVQTLQTSDRRVAEAAMEAIRRWKFRPAEKDGHPVACRMTLPFQYSYTIR